MFTVLIYMALNQLINQQSNLFFITTQLSRITKEGYELNE